MRFPDKSIIKKLIISLLAIAIIITIAYAATFHFKDQALTQLNAEVSNDFINYVDSGDIDESLKLWPQVYTTKKDDVEFLEVFSNSLQNTYYKYYDQTYIEQTKSENIHELCRIFYDFITEENFNSVLTIIYDDFYNEVISYEEFNSALNDFNVLSKLKSSYIPILLIDASSISDSRNTYFNAIETASIEDYSSAIELMRTVSTKDTIYYPKAIEKIDEYILKLKEVVKNGN